MGEERWLLQHEGTESYHSTSELQSLARAGRLDGRALVYHPLRDRWMYVEQAEELRDVLRAPAPAQASAGALVVRGPGALTRPPSNDAAVAGFTLGVLGIIPVVGAICALVGLPLAVRGLRRSEQLEGQNRGFAVAGLILTLTALLLNGGLTLLALLG